MFSIICLTWNGEKYLNNLFENLDTLEYPRQNFHLIFADSGSTDRTLHILKNKLKQNKIDKLFEYQKNLGFAQGNNLAIEWAIKKGSQYIILIGQDTKLEANFLSIAKQTFNNNPQIGVIQPLIFYYNSLTEVNSWGNYLHILGHGFAGGNHQDINNHPQKQSSIRDINYASGAIVCYRTQMLQKTGLFDETFFSYHEDSDLCLKAKTKGWRVVCNPKLIAYHDAKFPTTKNKNRYYWMERNRIYLVLKFYQFKTLFLLLPLEIFMSSGQLIFSIKNGYLWQFIKIRLWLIFNLKTILKNRKKIQKERKINDKILLKDFKSTIEYQEVDNFLLNRIGNPIFKFYWKLIKKII